MVAKAVLAIAALTLLADWAARSTLDRATLGSLAMSDVADPKTTGSIEPRRRPASAQPMSRDFDQLGLMSLMSDAAGPVTPKKR